MPKDLSELLLQARMAAAARDIDRALALMLDAWRATPADPIARAIETLGSRAATELLPPTGKTVKLKNAAWNAAARGDDPVIRHVLLASLTDTKGNPETLARIEILIRLPPDPRVSQRITDLVETPIYNASVSRTSAFWKRAFELLPELHDPRVLVRANRFAAAWAANKELNDPEQPLLEQRLAKVMPALEAAYGRGVPSLSTNDRVTCEAVIDAASQAPQPTTKTKQTERDLLAAIYANPELDDARLVYADWLQDQGDPRGEFISLQIARARRSPTPEHAKREKALIAEFATRWLAPFAVNKTGARFERGFLVACQTSTGIDENTAWSTVREINALPASDRCHVPALRVVTGTGNGGIERLADLAQPLAIEQLTWDGPILWNGSSFDESGRRAIEAFARIKVLPKLRTLVLRGSSSWSDPAYGSPPMAAANVAWAWQSPCAQNLEELTFPADLRALPELHASIAATNIRRVTLCTKAESMWPGWQLTFERDPSGELSRLSVRGDGRAPSSMLAPFYGREVTSGLEALPPSTLTAATVDVPANAWPAFHTHQHASLAHALARQRRLSKPTIAKC